MAAFNFLHPGVASRIVDNSILPTSGVSGATLLFAPHFCEKGKDNTPIIIDGPSERNYSNVHGTVDFLKYGQAQDNIINWLMSGGSVLSMRLLPHDATYAHAIIDMQIKDIEYSTWVLDGQEVTQKTDESTGEIYIVLPDGTDTVEEGGEDVRITTEAQLTSLGCTKITRERKLLRPRIKRTDIGATSTTTIDAYMEALTGSLSEDGFKHYPLGYFVANGRGDSFYNELLVDIDINSDYDDTFPTFRVYNVNLFLKDVTGNLTEVDSGPYLVSFDPTALSKSNESLFIGDVLTTYANEVKFVFNEEGFEQLGEELNPEVDPGKLDYFFLKEMEPFSGEVGTDHEDIVPITFSSLITADVAAGATDIFVEDAKKISSIGELIVGGMEVRKVADVDIITNKVTLTTALTGSYEEGSVVTSIPNDEFRSVALVTDPADYPTNVVEAADVLIDGVQLVKPGEAKLVVDGAETDITIVSVDTNTNEITLTDDINPSGAIIAIKQYSTYEIDSSITQDFDEPVALDGGSEGYKIKEDGSPVLSKLDKINMQNALLADAYRGTLNERVLLKKVYPIDVILDANYPDMVKDACNDLASKIRQDCVFLSDVGFTANPEQAINKRIKLGYSNFYTAIFSQDFTKTDSSSGREVRVTQTNYCAGKIPTVDNTYGFHYPFAGPRRGVLSGFNSLSWNPTPAWEDRLYKAQINYVKQEPNRTMIYGNLTSQTVRSALSDLSHVRVLLRMVRRAEAIANDYPFELINETTMTSMQYAINQELGQYVTNGACRTIEVKVYGSDYDMRNKLLRVSIDVVFTDILERIFLTFNINR